VRRVLCAPLLHFFALGALLFGARTWWAARAGAPAREPIVLTAADVARLGAEWKEEHGTAPDAAAEAALVRRAIDEEVLWREALAAGVPDRDPATRARLAQLGQFLGEDGGRTRLEREARDLGLARSDLVIRRHVVEAMRLALAKPAFDDVPTDADLEAWVDAHAAELTEPAAVRLAHVYLSAAAHGAALEADAAALLATLRQEGADPSAVETRGDPFLRGARLGPVSDEELDRLFGPGFARALAGAPLSTWVGPVRSSYGLHLVWIEERLPARVPTLAQVRSHAVLGLLRERGARRAAARLAQLRAAYDVRIASPALSASARR
jgi:hypothetical protein